MNSTLDVVEVSDNNTQTKNESMIIGGRHSNYMAKASVS